MKYYDFIAEDNEWLKRYAFLVSFDDSKVDSWYGSVESHNDLTIVVKCIGDPSDVSFSWEKMGRKVDLLTASQAVKKGIIYLFTRY